MLIHIPKLWQDEIEANTLFGVRAASAISKMTLPTTTLPVVPWSPQSIVTTPAPNSLDTEIMEAIVTATGQDVICDACRQYLETLRTMQILDCEEIIENLATIIQLPQHMHEQCNTQQSCQEWLRPIVEAILLNWVDDLMEGT